MSLHGYFYNFSEVVISFEPLKSVPALPDNLIRLMYVLFLYMFVLRYIRYIFTPQIITFITLTF